MKIPVLVKIHSVIHSEGEPTPYVSTGHTEGELDYTDEKITLKYSE